MWWRGSVLIYAAAPQLFFSLFSLFWRGQRIKIPSQCADPFSRCIGQGSAPVRFHQTLSVYLYHLYHLYHLYCIDVQPEHCAAVSYGNSVTASWSYLPIPTAMPKSKSQVCIHIKPLEEDSEWIFGSVSLDLTYISTISSVTGQKEERADSQYQWLPSTSEHQSIPAD